VLRTGVEADVPLKRVIAEIAAHDYGIADPPDRQSPWVDEVVMRVSVFRQRLADMEQVASAYLAQVCAGFERNSAALYRSHG
jgi:hypothetical protein